MATISILDTLATLPSGKPGHPLSLEELGNYLKSTLGTESEKQRNHTHAIRDELYRDGGVQYMKSVIDTLYRDPVVQELRKKQVEHARFKNPMKKVVNEISTTHAEPATRTVDGDANNEKYQAVLKATRFDEYLFQATRLLNLHRALLVGFRVRQLPDGTREPVLDIATPATVRAVTHPNDDKLVLGWMIRTCHKPARKLVDVPVWNLWTDHEVVSLREDLTVISDSYQAHGLGVNPWVAVTLSPPQPGFWPGCEGADLQAAMVSTWHANILLMKETKSATKQNVLMGDATTLARGQSADSEVQSEVPDGMSVTTVDMSMDLEMFTRVADHIADGVADSYGVMRNSQSVQSADILDLMRTPLKELRKHQQVPLRVFEAQLAYVMSLILKIDLPELAFDLLNWRIIFGEPEIPMSQTEKVELFIAKRQIGADNIAAFIMRENPGMTFDQAMDQFEFNMGVNYYQQLLTRPSNAVSGANAGQLGQGGEAVPLFPLANSLTAASNSTLDLAPNQAVAPEVIDIANQLVLEAKGDPAPKLDD